ncbi:MAG TPA: LCP family protein [Rectinemataceae bacterium]
MRNTLFDKSKLLLWAIGALFLAAIVWGAITLRRERAAIQLDTDKPLQVLMIFEQGGKPASTQLLMFYPAKGKSALLDIPSNMAVILTTMKRMDRIDLSYKAGNPRNFIKEVSSYLDTDIDGYVLFDESGFASIVDLLDGLPLFIPTMILKDEEPRVRLPGGAVTLDGEKAVQYLLYREETESESDTLARRQKLALALIKKISEKSFYMRERKNAAILASSFKSDLGLEARKRLLSAMSAIEADTIFLQKITGVYRSVEEQKLFFPFYDGELARDMLKQTLGAMSQATLVAPSKRVFTVEVLNGTLEKGLAARTADIFESFGYEVVSVGNAPSLDYAKTVILDRYGDKDALAGVAGVIKCEKFGEAFEYKGAIKADFTVILGSDFDGRVCVR